MAKLKKTKFHDTHYQPRGWGWERWIENIPEYCGKVLHVFMGKRGSLHFHMDKLETMFLVEGLVDLLFIDPDDGSEYTIRLNRGDSMRIPRGQPHQIIALEDSDIVEFSTIHSEIDSHRIRKGD